MRRFDVTRTTRETDISLSLNLDGPGGASGAVTAEGGGAGEAIATPLPFLSHMLEAFAKHGRFGLDLQAQGDTEIDGHHTTEDIGLVLGQAFKGALGDRGGIARYGHAVIPMDETLVTVAIDFSGRPAFVWSAAGLDGKWIGTFDCELAKEFFGAFATRAECNLHVLVHYGSNAHHIIEAIFKAFAKACDMATTVDQRIAGAVPSTKGTLTA